MGQRVNIQYSVDIEELGTEVHRLLSDVHTKLRDVSADSHIPDDLLSLGATDYIDNMRLKLAAIDHTLNDINVIVGSYLAYKSSLLVPSEATSPHVDAEQMARMEEIVRGTSPNLPTLQDVMSQFKNVDGQIRDAANEEST